MKKHHNYNPATYVAGIFFAIEKTKGKKIEIFLTYFA